MITTRSLVIICHHVCMLCHLGCVQLFVTQWTDCSPPNSSVHGILQARTLEWVDIFLLQEIFLTQGPSPRLLHLLHWQAASLPLVPPGKPNTTPYYIIIDYIPHTVGGYIYVYVCVCIYIYIYDCFTLLISQVQTYFNNLVFFLPPPRFTVFDIVFYIFFFF